MERKSYKREYMPEFFDDVNGILKSFTDYGSSDGARRIRDKLRKSLELCMEFPYYGSAVHDDELSALDFRMIVIEKYILFYRIFEDENKVLFYRMLNGTINCRYIMGKYENEEEK